MKRLVTVLFAEVICASLSAQIRQNSIVDLSAFCPFEKFQYKATCYAYAVTYTAMSTEYNIKNGITDTKHINAIFFSAGVVASNHNFSLPIPKKSPNCGNYGTADIALEILKRTGTTLNTTYDCNCENYNRIKRAVPALSFHKITGYTSIQVDNKYSDNSINWIKRALDLKHPVILGLFQNSRLNALDTSFIDDSLPDLATLSEIAKNGGEGSSNHVLCIVGFNEKYRNGKGYFLIKNNFEDWGNGKGFAWIPYTYILPLVEQAYYINGIQ